MSIYERLKAQKEQDRVELSARQKEEMDEAAELRAALKAQLMAVAADVGGVLEPEVVSIKADGHSISVEVLHNPTGGNAIVKVRLSKKGAGRNGGFVALAPDQYFFDVYVMDSKQLAYTAESMDSKKVYYTLIPETRIYIKDGQLRTQVLAAFEAFLNKAEIFD